MNSVLDTSKFAIYFDYLCKNNPKYSDNSDDKYINAYIVKLYYDDNLHIVDVFDIEGNNIDINDIGNADLIERINKGFYFDVYISFDIAKHNLIYTIYFGQPKKDLIGHKYNGNSYYYDKNENILRECFHINGKIEGKFIGYDSISYYLKYDINYVNGKMHGKYIKYYHNGQVQTELNIVDGKIIGKTYSYHDDGSIHTECTYVDGNIEGEYITYGNKIYFSDIIVSISNYVNGKLNGKSYDYSVSKDKYTIKSDCDYVNGKRNGVKNIYENCKIVRTITYKNNKKNGLSTYMGKTKYGNGQYITNEKTYENGKRHGISKYYNDLGQITITKTYKNDRCYNESYYYSTGVKKESIDITYNDTPIYGECNMCTKEFNITKKYNESGELVNYKKKTKIIEHDGYENCLDSDYYEERTYSNKYDKDGENDEKISMYEYLHFIDI